MIASEFDDRPARVENRPNDHKFQAGCLGCAGGLSARMVFARPSRIADVTGPYSPFEKCASTKGRYACAYPFGSAQAYLPFVEAHFSNGEYGPVTSAIRDGRAK